MSLVELTDGGRGGGGGVEEPNRTTVRKPGPLKIVEYSLFPPAPAVTHIKWLTAALKVQ